MRWCLPILFVTVSFAKPMRNSESDAIRNSDLILVGDLVSGHKSVQNGFLDCHARVRCLRILRGSGHSGREIAVHWQYEPRQDQPTDSQPDIGTVHAIWFLQRQPDSREYEAMLVNVSQMPMGGYFLPVPDSSPAGPLSYRLNADYQEKLASELAAAMLTIAAGGSARLDMQNRVAGTALFVLRAGSTKWFHGADIAGVSSEDAKARTEFNAIGDLFNSLDAAQIQSVCAYLIQQGDIHVAAVGLLGELYAKKPDALFVMEKLYPRLNVTVNSYALAVAAGQIDLSKNTAAIGAVGRMSVSNVRVFPFTIQAAPQLASSRSRSALPYLETLLLDQELNVSTEAGRGICAEFASDSDLRALADRQLIEACRFTIVAVNRIGKHDPSVGASEVNVKALRTWLDSHARDVQKVTGVNSPAPAWFFEPLDPATTPIPGS